MKKVLVGIATALLVVLMCFTMAGCDKSGSIKKAFENDGYTVAEMTSKDNDTVKSLLAVVLNEDQIKEVDKYSVFVCSKKVVLVDTPLALYIKFSSSGEMKDFLTVENSEGKKDTAAYDNAVEKGWVNGNCLLMTLSNDALKTFKNA